jgi:dephospho-CoA kinase
MKVIAFTGLKQSGKDTAAEQFKLMHLPARSLQINFADALKQEVAHACGTTVAQINAHKDNFRLILQGWGTDFRRKMHGDNYWTLKWIKSLTTLAEPLPSYLLCSDVRFLNEADVIRQLHGTIIRTVRPGLVSDGHASEVEQESIVADYTIANDGSIEDLRNKLKQIKL